MNARAMLMKTLTKITAAFLLAALIVSCGSSSGNKAKDDPTGGSAETDGGGTNATGEVSNLQSDVYHPKSDPKTMPYNYSNKLKGGEMCDTGTGVVIRYSQQYKFFGNNAAAIVLVEYDKASGEVYYLCQDATCRHTEYDQKCPSSGISSVSVEFYRGNVYTYKTPDLFSYDWDKYPDISGPLYNIAEINAEKRTLKIIDSEVTQHLQPFFRDDNYLYVYTTDYSLIRYKNGSAKPEVVFESGLEYSPLLSIYASVYQFELGGWLYGCFDDEIVRYHVDTGKTEKVADAHLMLLVDGGLLYYYDKEFNIDRCALDGSGVERVLDKNRGGGLATVYDDDYLYYTGLDENDPDTIALFRLKKDLSTEPEQLCIFDIDFTIYTAVDIDLLFLRGRIITPIEGTGTEINGVIWGESEREDVYCTIRKDGTGLKRLVMPDMK